MSDSVYLDRLRLRNFLSFGPEWTEIDLRGNYITAVMGENLDTGGENSRNGTGKSSIGDAIAYALNGKTIRMLTNTELVNKMARRGQAMSVELYGHTSTESFCVERGEKPSVLNFYRKPIESEEDFRCLNSDGRTEKYNVSKSKAETTADIQELTGFNSVLTEYLLINSTESDPFPRLREEDRRKFAENLFNITLLSKRAKTLKEERTKVSREITVAESTIEATRQANRRIQTEIVQMEQRSQQWERAHVQTVEELRRQISRLEAIDLEEEIETLNLIVEITDNLNRIAQDRRLCLTEKATSHQAHTLLESANKKSIDRCERIIEEIEAIDQSICPTCQQHWEPDPTVRAGLLKESKSLQAEIDANKIEQSKASAVLNEQTERLKQIDEELSELKAVEQEIRSIPLTYRTPSEAAAATATLVELKNRLSQIEAETNPHIDSIRDITAHAVQEIDESEAEGYRYLLRHYNLLLDLLTKPDSYLRRALMEWCLPQLNRQIAYYLEILELPHRIRFEPDFSLSISDYGQEFGWGGLSRGQRQRVNIALNFAFQDIYEAMNNRVSLLVLDEIIDAGICNRGATNVLHILNEIRTKKDKRILLITHREDISAQIADHMTVKLKNKISWIENEGIDEA